MKGNTQVYLDRLFELANSNIPDRVIYKAKVCFLDYIAVTVGGSRIYQKKNSAYIQNFGSSGRSHVIGSQLRSDLRNACLINAFNAHTLELDDSHRVAMTHLGAPIFSALVSVAEMQEKTIDDILEAAVVGYEAAIRIANTIQPGHKKRGFHVSGTCCTIGAAIAIASLMKYTREEFTNVLSAAASSAAGLLAISAGRSEQKPYNIAHAAVSGLDAALYAKMFVGAEDIFEDSRGFFHAFTDTVDAGKLIQDGYGIESIYQKLYAACRHCHAPMEAMLNLTKEHPLDPNAIQSITVDTYDLAIKGHDHTDIQGRSSAKQSIPYGVAIACMYKDCGETSFSDEKLENQDLLCLIKKVQVKEDTKLSDMVPDKRAARVSLILNDGTALSEQVDYAKGEPENPITYQEMIEKFKQLCFLSGFSQEQNDQIIQAINNPGLQVRQLLEIITGGSKS